MSNTLETLITLNLINIVVCFVGYLAGPHSGWLIGIVLSAGAVLLLLELGYQTHRRIQKDLEEGWVKQFNEEPPHS